MRVVARVFIFLIVLGFLLGPAIYLARDSLAPMVVSLFARTGLGIDDLGDPRFRITHIGPNGLTLEGLAMAGDLVEADSVSATFDLTELSKGRLRTLAIRGLTIRARLQDGKLSLGSIELPRHSESKEKAEPPKPDQFPLDHLVLEDVRLVVTTDTDTIELAGDIDVHRSANGSLDWSGDLSAGLSSALLGGGKAKFGLVLDGSLSVAGDISTTLDLKHGEARFRDLSLASARGGIRGRLPFGADPTVRAALSFDDVAARRIVIPRLSLDVHGQGRSGTVSAVIGDPSSGARAYTIVGDISHDENDHAKVAFSGSGALGVLHDLLGPALGSPLHGIRGDLAFNGEVGFRGAIDDFVAHPEKGLAQAVGSGAAKVAVSSIDVGGNPHALDIRGGVTAVMAPGLMEIRLTERSRARIPKSTSRVIAESVPRIVQPWLVGGASIDFAFDDEPLAILASFGGESPKLRFSGGARARLGGGGVISLGGTATVGPPSIGGGGIWNATFEGLILRAGGLEVDGHRLTQGEAFLGGRAGPDGIAGRFSIKGDATFSDNVPLAGTTIHLDGKLVSAGHETQVSLERAGATPRPRGGDGGGFMLLEPVEISQAPGFSSVIVVSHASDGPLPRSFETAWEAGVVTLGRPDDGIAKAVKLDIGRIGATFANATSGGDGRFVLKLDGARIDAAGIAVQLSDLIINAGFKAGDILDGLTSIDSAIAKIASIAAPPWIAPLAFKMSGQRRGPARALDLQGSVTGMTSSLEIPFSGTIQLNDGSGRLEIDKTWLTFGPEALSLAALSPAFSTHVETMTGRVGLSGHVAWPAVADADAERLTVDVEALSMTGTGLSVENAEGSISFSNIMPLRSDGVGTLSMDMLGVGVPIPRPRLEVSIDDLDGIMLRKASGGFAGGRISTRDVQVAFDGPTSMTVEAEGVDAAAITSMLKVKGLAAEGSLSGELPVTWTPGLGVSIIDARLSADGPGRVRYEAGGKDEALRQSGEQVGLMLDALSDFRFKTLEMGLAGTPGSGFQVDLALEGANPNLYDGYPVRFNLDLAGQLDDIIKTGYRTYTLPDRVRDAVLRGEAND